jgi:MarR family 2-MHQ and catechol resistance regulon transcriptional repressor
MRATNSLTATIGHALASDRLTISQFGVLEALYHLGPLQQHTIGDKLLKSGGNITMVVDNLEKRGLIERERCKEDRRCIRVKLTGSGKDLISKVYPRIAELIREAFAVIPQEDMESLNSTLRRLGHSESLRK